MPKSLAIRLLVLMLLYSSQNILAQEDYISLADSSLARLYQTQAKTFAISYSHSGSKQVLLENAFSIYEGSLEVGHKL